jgi:hypothetical protein
MPGKKAGRAGDDRGEPREDAPGDHDAGDPQPRADLFEDHVARHLEDEIAPVERAEGKPVFAGRDAEIAAHRQRREADVDPVDIGQEIAEDREGQQADIDLPHARFFDKVHRHSSQVPPETSATRRRA